MGKTAKYLLLTIFTLLILFTAAIAVCAHVDFFTVEDIYITNNQKFEYDHFDEITSSYVGSNGFMELYRNVGSIKDMLYALALRDHCTEIKYLKSSPYIKSIKINFSPPSGLRIDIMERHEAYMVRFLDKEILISSDLVVLGENKDSRIPEISGIELTNYVIGSELKLSDEIKGVLGQIKNSSVYKGRSVFEKIKKIQFDDALSLVLHNNIVVVFGSYADIDYKMKCLNDIYFEYLFEYNGGRLDLTKKDTKVYHPG